MGLDYIAASDTDRLKITPYILESPCMNPITLLYFGDLMSRLQIGREQLRLPPSINDVAGLMRILAMRGGDWQQVFGQARTTLRITVNKTEAETSSSIKAGDEVAFIESISL